MIAPDECAGCGTTLSGRPGWIASRIHVFDTPPVNLQVTEYQLLALPCADCATVTRAAPPKGVAGPCCYGAEPGRPVFVGYPAAFDFMFVYWYLIRFAGSSPFSHAALDIKTYAMALLGTEYRATVKRAMPSNWFDDAPHTHVALDDAIEQGALFCAMLAANPNAHGTGQGSGT
jgi:hypothetical protein